MLNLNSSCICEYREHLSITALRVRIIVRDIDVVSEPRSVLQIAVREGVSYNST